MQYDPEFSIKFVQLVENHPVIYNQTLGDYAHTEPTRKAWEEIGAAINETADVCVKKWKALRGAYTRFLRSGSNGRKEYYLAKYMEFLMPYLKYKPRLKNASKDKSHEQKRAFEIFESVKQEHDESFDDLANSLDFSEHDSITREEEITIQQQASDTIQDFIPATRRQKTTGDDHSDPDMEFFKSILPDIRELPQRKKYIFRMSVLKTISELMENDTTRLALN